MANHARYSEERKKELGRQLQRKLAYIFGIAFLVATMVLAIVFPNPTPYQYIIFRTVISLAAAGVAAMFPGFIEVEIPNWVKAGGALAVFVLVYFYNPAELVTKPAPAPVSHQKESIQPKAEMSGTVLDHNDKPIQGAKITLDDFPGMQPVETSSDGIFTLKEIPKKYGEGVRIRVIKEDYQPNPYTEDVVLGKAPPRIKLTRKK